MDQQKMDNNIKNSFPLIEAMIITPEEGDTGQVGICSNTTAPGQVLNEIDPSLREYVSVIGPLIVSRDGSERMIINSLAHPTLRYLVLFSEESATFAPCTNLLRALMDGFDKSRVGNYVQNGVAAAPHYPSINERIFEAFKKNIVVLPVFMSKQAKSKETIAQYLEWLKPRINPEIHKLLASINEKDKIYYDSLKKLLALIAAEPRMEKSEIELDPIDFQHLQPPKIKLQPLTKDFDVPFQVGASETLLHLDLEIGSTTYHLEGNDPFLMAYSLMKNLGSDKDLLSPLNQLLLGAELGRVNTEIINKISAPSFVRGKKISGEKIISLEPQLGLIVDKKYYYKINTRGKDIAVSCLSFDVCEPVFELVSLDAKAIIDRIASNNRFEVYSMDILHRIDVGMQIGQAAVAASLGYSFIQDFSAIFKINTEKLPNLCVVSDNFLDVHKGILRRIYTEGITEEHGDPWKGPARSACMLAVYRQATKALETMPAIYKQGDQDQATIRANYKEQLLRRDHDGSYSYGERTRSYFGIDQLTETMKTLKKDPSRAAIIQRFDPATDMSEYVDPDSGKTKYTHDPCLSHDIFFIQNGKLHSFHIARAHNTVNAYPENIFGLFDAYLSSIASDIGLPIGDTFMLSSRANILLLTEDQRTKRILSEPSKPTGETDNSSGPYLLGDTVKNLETEGGVAYLLTPLREQIARPQHPTLARLENYESVNTVSKGIDYLKRKGAMHNNVVLSEYYAGKTDPQADQLAFLQMNVFGKKVYVTAVFMNRSIKNQPEDSKLANYIATKLKNVLGDGISLGELSLYYVAYKI